MTRQYTFHVTNACCADSGGQCRTRLSEAELMAKREYATTNRSSGRHRDDDQPEDIRAMTQHLPEAERSWAFRAPPG